MSPVSPIHTLPSIVMPTGVRPVGQERKREPDPGPDHKEEAADDGSPPSAAESPRESDPELNPDDRGRIIDIKA